MAAITSSGSGAKGLVMEVDPYWHCCGAEKVFTATAWATGEDADKATVSITGPRGTHASGEGHAVLPYETVDISPQDTDCGEVADVHRGRAGAEVGQQECIRR